MAREHQAPDSLGPQLKREFGGVYIANEGFPLESANELVERGDADGVSFGKWFIANPDLPRRLREGAPLNEPRPELFYSHEAEGYTDYPPMA